MKQPRYRPVPLSVMADPAFRQLSAPAPNAQDLFFRGLLCAGTDSSIPGLHAVTLTELADRASGRPGSWSRRAALRCWQEVEDAGLAIADWEAGVVWEPGALGRPGGPRAISNVTSWRQRWSEIPGCALKERARAAWRDWCEDQGPAYLEAFEAACPAEAPSQLRLDFAENPDVLTSTPTLALPLKRAAFRSGIKGAFRPGPPPHDHDHDLPLKPPSGGPAVRSPEPEPPEPEPMPDAIAVDEPAPRPRRSRERELATQDPVMRAEDLRSMASETAEPRERALLEFLAQLRGLFPRDRLRRSEIREYLDELRDVDPADLRGALPEIKAQALRERRAWFPPTVLLRGYAGEARRRADADAPARAPPAPESTEAGTAHAALIRRAMRLAFERTGRAPPERELEEWIARAREAPA